MDEIDRTMPYKNKRDKQAYDRKYYLRKKGDTKYIAMKKRYRSTHKKEAKQYHLDHKEQHNRKDMNFYLSHKKERRKRYREKRKLVLDHYGGKCACCGESQYEFLAIDHIAGRGTQHKKKARIGHMIDWLVKNNYPKGYRVLCHNCNQAIGFYGKCPHKIRKKS